MNYSLIDDAFSEASSMQRRGRGAAIASFLASLGSGWRLFGVEDLGVVAVNCRVHVVHGAVANFHVVPVEEILLIWCDFGKCLSIRLRKVLATFVCTFIL